MAFLDRVYTLNSGQKEVIQYGFVVFFSSVTGVVLIGLFSYILGLLYETFLVLAAAGALRVSAGGGHCSAPWRCNFLGLLLFPGLGYLVTLMVKAEPNLILCYSLISFLLALLLVKGWAPVITANKKISSTRKYKLRLRSYVTLFVGGGLAAVFLTIGILPVVAGIATGLLWQSLTLTPPVRQVIWLFDGLLVRCSAIWRREGA